MAKTLTRNGNSLVLTIDKPILEATGIDADTQLEISTDGDVIVISPVRSKKRTAKLEEITRVHSGGLAPMYPAWKSCTMGLSYHFDCSVRRWRATIEVAAALSCGVFFSVLSAAQALPAEAAPASLEPSLPVEVVPGLAPVPELRLSVPQLLSSVPVRNEAAVGGWPAYWRDASVSSAWRDFADAELRLEVETWRTQRGPLSISTQLVSTPERERKCQPHCQGPGLVVVAAVEA